MQNKSTSVVLLSGDEKALYAESAESVMLMTDTFVAVLDVMRSERDPSPQ